MTAAACEICGASRPGEGDCPRCGAPGLPEAAARPLGESAALAAEGRVDQAIHRAQQAAKAAPGSWRPRLRLAALYERKVANGEPALRRLASRELDEALRLAPDEREVHLTRLGLAAGRGAAAVADLRREYESRLATWPPAAEFLRMLDALPAAGAGEASAAEPDRFRARVLLLGGTVAAALGVLELLVLLFQAQTAAPAGAEEAPGLLDQIGQVVRSVHFYLCVGLFVAASACFLEGVRERRRLGS